MDEPWEYSADRKEPGTEHHTFDRCIYVKYPGICKCTKTGSETGRSGCDGRMECNCRQIQGFCFVFWGEEMIWNQTMLIDAWPYENTENHSTVHFQSVNLGKRKPTSTENARTGKKPSTSVQRAESWPENWGPHTRGWPPAQGQGNRQNQRSELADKWGWEKEDKKMDTESRKKKAEAQSRWPNN